MSMTLQPNVSQQILPLPYLHVLTGTDMQCRQALKEMLAVNTMLDESSLASIETTTLDSLSDGKDDSLEDDYYEYHQENHIGSEWRLNIATVSKTAEDELKATLALMGEKEDSVVFKVCSAMLSDLDSNGFLRTSEKGFDAKMYASIYLYKHGRQVDTYVVEKAKSLLLQTGTSMGVAGLGTCGPQDALLYQLKQKKGAAAEVAKAIVTRHYHDLLNGRDFLDKLKSQAPGMVSFFPDGIALLERLKAFPMSGSSGQAAQQVKSETIDVTVFENSFEISQGNAPALVFDRDSIRVFEEYAVQFEKGQLSKPQTEAYRYMKKDVRSLETAIRLVEAREKGHQAIISTLVAQQLSFLSSFDFNRLKSISLSELAEKAVPAMQKALGKEGISVSESTVRNCLRHKTIRTSQGSIALKDLAPSEIRLKLLRGGSVAIQVIQNENRLIPLSDKAVAQAVKAHTNLRLTEKNVTAIRRQFNIPSAVIRKARHLASDSAELAFLDAKSQEAKFVKAWVESEEQRYPLSDRQLSDRLNKQGLNEKYDAKEVKLLRESLGIPDPSVRLTIYRKQEASRGYTSDPQPYTQDPLSIESSINLK